jgi:hypothetical protein
VVETEEDRVGFYQSLAEALMGIEPWKIPGEMSIAQQAGFFAREKPVNDNMTHEEFIERVQRVRKKRGLPPLMPAPEKITHEFRDGQWRPIQKDTQQQ